MRCFYDRILALVFALGLVIAGAMAAHAGPYEDALLNFTEGSLHDTGEAIDKVVASGNPLAEPLLKALKDARLMFSAEQKKVLIQTGDDKLIDAATGQPFTGKVPDDLDNVIVNNRLRNVINAALGTLTLMSANADTRYNAAQAVFKSRDMSALPNLEKALAKETDPRVRRALEQARAAVILTDPKSSADAKITAIEVIRDRGDQDSLGLLDGLPHDLPPAVLAAVAQARALVAHTLALWNTVQNAWYGLSLGSVLLLAAIGLAITFGVMGVINMAHGEMVMLGAYTTFVVQQLIRELQPGAVRLLAGDRAAACLHGIRRRRHHRGAHHHPLPLWAPAGNPARHLGPFARSCSRWCAPPSGRPTRTSAILRG